MGLSLGAVLIYLLTSYTAQTVAGQWVQAAPMAAALVSVLTGRRGVMATGAWSATALVRLNGTPEVTASLLRPRPGTEMPPIMRVGVGPMVWEICDAAAYASLVAGWRSAARLLAAVDNSAEE